MEWEDIKCVLCKNTLKEDEEVMCWTCENITERISKTFDNINYPKYFNDENTTRN